MRKRNEIKKEQDAQEQTKVPKIALGKKMAQVLSGEFLSGEFVINNMGFLLFLVLLALVYIGNGTRTQGMVREINRLEKEVHELRSEYITTSSDLSNTTKQSELVKIINEKGMGLEESVVPPGKIEITESDYEDLKEK